MKIHYTSNKELEDAFKKVNALVQEEYGEKMIEVVGKELGISKEELKDKSLNDILGMLSNKWDEMK